MTTARSIPGGGSFRRWLSIGFVAIVLGAASPSAAGTDHTETEAAHLQADILNWVQQVGTAESDGYQGVAATDSGIFAAGATEGELPGQTAAGGPDAFLQRFDQGGTLLWTRQFGTTGSDDVAGVAATDSAAYVAGDTDGSLAGGWPPGSGDVYVRAFDLDGDELWTVQLGSSSVDSASGIALDSTGIYVAGETMGTLPGQTRLGLADGLLAKLDFDGNIIWAVHAGTEESDAVTGVDVDATGVYLAGMTGADLHPPTETNQGLVDGFLQKFDKEGVLLWGRNIGSADNDGAKAVLAGDAGVFVAGQTDGVFQGQTQAGLIDVFLAKYTPNGSRQWIRQFGGSNEEGAEALEDGDGGVYVVGVTESALPGQDPPVFGAVFVRRYGDDGSAQWTRQLGTTGGDVAWASSMVGSTLILAGETLGAFPGHTNAGIHDAWVATLGPRNLTVSVEGPGSGGVASSPPGIECPDTCERTTEIGTLVTLTPDPAPGSYFAGWDDGCSGAGACAVVVDGDTSVSASFGIARRLTAATSGDGSGTVTSAPAGIDCPPSCAADFADGAIVALSAAPGPGSYFGGWGGACTGTDDCQVTLDDDSEVTAIFHLPMEKRVFLKKKPKRVLQGRKVTLRARVSPCTGHEGDRVQLLRKAWKAGKRVKMIATELSSDTCTAVFRVKMRRTLSFRAVAPQQDNDHLAGRSKWVRVQVRRR